MFTIILILATFQIGGVMLMSYDEQVNKPKVYHTEPNIIMHKIYMIEGE